MRKSQPQSTWRDIAKFLDAKAYMLSRIVYVDFLWKWWLRITSSKAYFTFFFGRRDFFSPFLSSGDHFSVVRLKKRFEKWSLVQIKFELQ